MLTPLRRGVIGVGGGVRPSVVRPFVGRNLISVSLLCVLLGLLMVLSYARVVPVITRGVRPVRSARLSLERAGEFPLVAVPSREAR